MVMLHVFLLYYSGHLSVSEAIADSFVSNVLFAAIGLGLWFPIFFGKSDEEKLLNTIINNIFGAVVAISFWIGISYFILTSLLNSATDYIGFLKSSIPWRAGIGLLYYEVIILVYYLMIYYRNNKENQLKEAELKALVTESQLNSLKSQINPHFLFNSLNSISSLTMTQPAKAQEMIIKLSEFLRYTTSNKDERFTTLEEEMNNINRYLDIEKIRFGKRMLIRQSIDEHCRKLKLPGLILQPLLENAIKYGVYESIDESVIEIICNCNSAALSVIVRNKWDPEFQSKKGEGVGLKNIRSRLGILYNRDDLFKIRKESDLFEVNIVFPQ